MKAVYNNRTYEFRVCDTKHLTQEELQQKVTKTGRLQYEPGRAWLFVSGVGYGWETTAD